MDEFFDSFKNFSQEKLGLILIAIGWSIEAYFIYKGKQINISKITSLLYILGLMLLIFNLKEKKVNYFELFTSIPFIYIVYKTFQLSR